MNAQQFNQHPGILRIVQAGLLLLLGWVLLKTAWVCDDAFITFSCSSNLVEGKGLTFQPFERVQAFSNPLWTLIMAVVRGVTGKVWVPSMVLGIGLTLTFAFLLLRKMESVATCFLTGMLLICSIAFVNFSTSGLENPLSHLLLLLFGMHLLRDNKGGAWLMTLFFLGSLAMLNRLDLGLVVGPALIGAFFWGGEHRGRWKAAVLGLLPLLTWELFSLIYYGSFLPNTWYAKLGTGADRLFLLEKGWIYLLDTFLHDPVTILLILGALVFGFWKGRREVKWLALGMLLYLLAVSSAGGDFMRGRMFTVPFALGALIFLQMRFPSKWTPGLFGLGLLLVGGFQIDAPLYSGPNYHMGRTENPATLYPNNIVDERALYWQKTGWFANHGLEIHPMKTFEGEAATNRALEIGKPVKVKRVGAIGMAGYRAEPGVHLLDELALADPLLARLPAMKTSWWRAGHRPRLLPEGYETWLLNNEDDWEDGKLKAYNEELALLTRGEIWSLPRWKAIGDHLFSSPGVEIDRRRYRLAWLDFHGNPIQKKDTHPLSAKSKGWRPLRFIWETTQHPMSIGFDSPPAAEIRVEIFENDKLVFNKVILPQPDGTNRCQINLSAALQEGGLDEILIYPTGLNNGVEVKSLLLSPTSLQAFENK